ncbi:phosphatidylcholine synthase [Novosphingobium endophyticum]|uniref:Phosphatidylcholine synthase n=2 Tax=Novosphingobium endophyticum TaxID=1955250 RepID=A0A916TVH8_9SPHN|nr:phosphatidylcholine synthase [Novosphingobium endophyticum]
MDRMPRDDLEHSRRRILAAWAVHLLTASGALWALLALNALWHDDWREVLFWLFIALVVDAVDGTLARAMQVSDYAPRVDGASLDLVVDYLNYVLVPAMLIWQSQLLPESVALPLSALILISSLYVFVRRDMKTTDGYFRGFPALWNVVAAYLLLIDLHEWVRACVVTLLALASFAPIFVVHPFRTRDFPLAARSLAIGWGLFTFALLLPNLADTARRLTLAGSIGCLTGLALMGVRRSFRPPPVN